MHKIIVKTADFLFLLAAGIVIAGAYLSPWGLVGSLVAFLGCCVVLSMWSIQRAILGELEKLNRPAAKARPTAPRLEPKL